ncbi:MAG TPA: hypothetical protein VIM04_08415, partial [Candidatus Binatia bacterium]
MTATLSSRVHARNLKFALTTQHPAQQSRNRKNRNISRKDAKARSKIFLISPSDTSPWVGMMAFDPSLSV